MFQQLDEVEPDDRFVFGYEDADAGRLPRAVRHDLMSGAARSNYRSSRFRDSASIHALPSGS